MRQSTDKMRCKGFLMQTLLATRRATLRPKVENAILHAEADYIQRTPKRYTQINKICIFNDQSHSPLKLTIYTKYWIFHPHFVFASKTIEILQTPPRRISYAKITMSTTFSHKSMQDDPLVQSGCISGDDFLNFSPSIHSSESPKLRI